MRTLEWVLVALRVAVGVWLFAALRTPRARRPPAGDRAPVSIVVPARDEAANLPHLLGSLVPQLHPADELFVVDDHSADGTEAVAARLGAATIAAPELPEGWTGKAWACATGAQATRHARLAFVDADTRFEVGGLDRVLAEHDGGGLVSVQPYHLVERWPEEAAAFFNLVAVAATDAGSPLGRRGSRGAFGPVLVTSRTDYQEVGGHEAVAGSVVDDLALAERYRATGKPVRIFAGKGSVAFRMYPQGLGQLVEGFTKNLAAGLAGVRPVTAALVAWWLTLTVQAGLAPLRLLVDAPWEPVALLYAVVVAQVFWMLRRLGNFSPLTALLFPLPLAVFLAVFVRSLLAARRGEVSWKGRRVRTR